ncbi:MAG: hypothetical protein AB1634_16525 [Thermodesulfobacteriota bacterium]
MKPTGLNIPWHRYALITELADRLQKTSPQFGKTVLQKMVYLLQEAFGVDCGYDFTLYTYGPFASQLLQDLALAESLGGVDVEASASAVGGYRITPGKEAPSVVHKGEAFLRETDVQQALTRLVDEFGNLNARELELRSTLVYVNRDLRRGGKTAQWDETLRLVQEIKPKFPPAEIEKAAQELHARGYLL